MGCSEAEMNGYQAPWSRLKGDLSMSSLGGNWIFFMAGCGGLIIALRRSYVTYRRRRRRWFGTSCSSGPRVDIMK